jgi:hypothetical protein
MSGSDQERALAMKSFGAFDIKDADKGEVEAVVATLNVVDRDREVILPGAIPNGVPVKLSGYGHDAMFGEAPVGKGHLFAQGDKMVFKGRFFMTTARGAEAFATLKELGTDQEWSFGFRVAEAVNATEEWAKKGAVRILKSLLAMEVSPVILGAGIGTQTLAMKSEGGAPEEEAAAAAALEAKAAAELEAERLAAEVIRQEDERAAQRAELKQAAAEEFERFQRNLRRFAR